MQGSSAISQDKRDQLAKLIALVMVAENRLRKIAELDPASCVGVRIPGLYAGSFLQFDAWSGWRLVMSYGEDREPIIAVDCDPETIVWIARQIPDISVRLLGAGREGIVAAQLLIEAWLDSIQSPSPISASVASSR